MSNAIDVDASIVLDCVELYSEPVDTVGRYAFSDSMVWVVDHNRNTTRFVESLTTADGERFYAKVKIVDANSFVVHLTEAMSGFVDVIFDTSSF